MDFPLPLSLPPSFPFQTGFACTCRRNGFCEISLKNLATRMTAVPSWLVPKLGLLPRAQAQTLWPQRAAHIPLGGSPWISCQPCTRLRTGLEATSALVGSWAKVLRVCQAALWPGCESAPLAKRKEQQGEAGADLQIYKKGFLRSLVG